jgi:PAS domain S-box-containing protein
MNDPQGVATDLAFLSEEIDETPYEAEMEAGSVGSVEEEEEDNHKLKEELLQLEVRILMNELDRLQIAADHQRAVAEGDEIQNSKTIAKLHSELGVCRKLIEFQHRELAAAETGKFVSESAIRAMKNAMDHKTVFVQQLQTQLETDRQVMKMALDAISKMADAKGAEVEKVTAEKEKLKAENMSLRRICASMGADWMHSGFNGVVPGKASSTEFGGGESSSSSTSSNALLSQEVVQEFKVGIEARGVKTAMCLCDDMGAIVWSNLLFSRITGYSATDVEGCIWSSFLCGPVTDAQDLAWMQRTIKMRQADCRCLQCYHASGRLFWLQVVMEPAVAQGASCVLMSLDDVTEIFERLMLHGDLPQHDSASIAAERISQLQQHAIDSGKEVLAKLSQLAGKHTCQLPGDNMDLFGHVHNWARTRPPEVASEADFDEVVLYPNSDTMELLKTGLLWQLKAAGLVSQWSWSWEHEGALKLRLDMALVLARSERVLSPMLAQDMSGWRLWWSRLLCALSVADAKARDSQEYDSGSERQKSISEEGSSPQLSDLMVAAANSASVFTTLAEAQQETDEARAICSAREPWLILEANEAFARMTSFTETEIKGRSLAMMQGAVDWPVLVNGMQSLVRPAGKGEACIMARSFGVQSFKRSGEPFQNSMSLVPILMEGELTHVLAIFRELPTDEDSNNVVKQSVRHPIAV